MHVADRFRLANALVKVDICVVGAIQDTAEACARESRWTADSIHHW